MTSTKPTGEPEFMIDCLHGKLVTLDAVSGYISILEMQKTNLEAQLTAQSATIIRMGTELAAAEAEREGAQSEWDERTATALRWKAERDEARAVLHSCLQDYAHSRFTDRHGMADRIRECLATGKGEG